MNIHFKKILLHWLFKQPPLNQMWHSIAPKGALILVYHGVCADDFQLLDGYDERHVRKTEFAWQVNYLKKNGYRFVSMTDLIRAIQTGESEVTPLVTITFDDGFANVLRNAIPTMIELEGKGCMYVIVSGTESRPYVWTDIVETVFWSHQGGKLICSFGGKPISFRLETRQEVISAIRSVKKHLRFLNNFERIHEISQFEEIFDNLPKNAIPEEFRLCQFGDLALFDSEVLEIGSHSMTHPNLSQTDDSELVYEVSNSKKSWKKN